MVNMEFASIGHIKLVHVTECIVYACACDAHAVEWCKLITRSLSKS